MPLSGLVDDSLDGLGAAFSGLSVGPSEGKEKETGKEAVDMGAGGVHHGHDPTDEVFFEDKSSESAPCTSEHPAVPSPTTSTLPASHPAISSPTTTPPMAEGLGLSGLPYPTYSVDSWQLHSANQSHPAPSTPVSVSLCRVATLMTITDPLRVCT